MTAAAAADDDASSSSSSSYSSDDEYLTSAGLRRDGGVGGDRAEEEREAIIRRKLMESFYGRSDAATADQPPTTPTTTKPSPPATPVVRNAKRFETRERDDEQRETTSKKKESDDPAAAASSSSKNDSPWWTESDLNSPEFDPVGRCASFLRAHDTATLLEADERLALDVRQLDSTMQTLVYENYSKFIDATDAVRGVNRSVDASRERLEGLGRSVARASALVASIDDALAAPRAAVAERVRVRDHLARLDGLLRLPATLREHVDAGRWRAAARAWRSAAGVLRQRSGGFESLRKIEEESRDVMRRACRDLTWRLVVWSRRGPASLSESYDDGRSPELRVVFHPDAHDYDRRDNADASTPRIVFRHDASSVDRDSDSERSAAEDVIVAEVRELPPLPSSVSEILECAGTFRELENRAATLGEDVPAELFDEERCRAMALEAVARSLRRTSEDAERRRLAREEGEDEDLATDVVHDRADRLDALRYAYGCSSSWAPCPSEEARGDGAPDDEDEDDVFAVVLDRLLEAGTLFGVVFPDAPPSSLDALATDALDDVLRRVRRVLLRRVDEGAPWTALAAAALRAARRTAGALALPAVGVDPAIAAAAAERATAFAETAARRSARRRLGELRDACAREDWRPAAEAAWEAGDATSMRREMERAVDGVACRAAGLAAETTAELRDAPVERDAARAAARGAVSWAAAALETMVGCDTIVYDPRDHHRRRRTLACAERDQNGRRTTHPEPGERRYDLDRRRDDDDDEYDDGTRSNDDDDDDERGDDPLFSLVTFFEERREADPERGARLVLAVAAVLRDAEVTLVDAVETALASLDDAHPDDVDDGPRDDDDGVLARRLRSAAERVLALYAADAGHLAADAARRAVRDLVEDRRDPDRDGDHPDPAFLPTLKRVSLDVAAVLGVPPRSAPFAIADDDDDDDDPYGGGALDGLVDRVFATRDPVLSDALPFDREAVVGRVAAIALAAAADAARTSSRLSAPALRRFRVAATLWRDAVAPHLVGDPARAAAVRRAADDAVRAARERSSDAADAADDDDDDVSPASLARRYAEERTDEVDTFVISSSS